VTLGSEYRDLFFNYQNVEHRAALPINYKQSFREFLEKFAEQRSDKKFNYTSKDFEIVKDGKYLKLDTNVDDLKTKAYDPKKLIILDDKLTINNLRFRNINNLSNPYEHVSHSFQDYIMNIVDNYELSTSKYDKKEIHKILKSLQNYNSNSTKIIIAISTYLEYLAKIGNNKRKNLDINFKTNFTLDLDKFNKYNKKGLIILDNKNGLLIPFNIVSSRNEEEKRIKFNYEIIENFDTLKKISLKYNIQSNIGIVTDFQSWKFNYFKRPDNDELESKNNYLTSLKYELSITSEFVNEITFEILSKIVHNFISFDTNEINSLNFS
jgi:hypothetical protein